MPYEVTGSTDGLFVANTIVVVVTEVVVEGTDMLTEVTGTETMLQVTGISEKKIYSTLKFTNKKFISRDKRFTRLG